MRDAGLDVNPDALKAKDISTDKVEFAGDIAFPKIENFDPVEEYKYAYIWAEAHPNGAPGPVIDSVLSPRATSDIKSDELAPRKLSPATPLQCPMTFGPHTNGSMYAGTMTTKTLGD